MTAANARWQLYLIDEGVRFVHYSTNKVRRQFGLDQDVPNDFSAILESTTFFWPFLQPITFQFWSKHFTAITISSSQREGLCTVVMHKYWQAMITSFGQELLGSHGVSLIPLDDFHAIISTNPRLLLPTKFVVVYARK